MYKRIAVILALSILMISSCSKIDNINILVSSKVEDVISDKSTNNPVTTQNINSSTTPNNSVISVYSSNSSSKAISSNNNSSSTSTSSNENSSSASTSSRAPIRPPGATVPSPMAELEVVINITPQITYVPQYDYSANIKAIFYTGMDYKGNPTRVFAYIGFPTGASSSNKVPAVVCVHGGGGMAYGEWVQKWIDNGYAAIAMDTYGNMPSKTGYLVTSFTRDLQGAAPYDAFARINDPINQQWPFYTISDAILANTILLNDDHIQKDNIGLTGVSWGGIFTGITAGVDYRFAFVIPVYGCGYLNEAQTYFKYYYQNKKIEDYWDVSKYLPFVTMPILWINGDSDGAFPLNSFSKTAENTKDSANVIKHLLVHGPIQGWSQNEIYSFANSICKGGNPLTKIVNQPTKSMGKNVNFDVYVPNGVQIVMVIAYYISVPLAYNTQSVNTNTWSTVLGSYSAGKVSVTLPDGVNSYYVNIATTDNFTTIISSTLLINLT